MLFGQINAPAALPIYAHMHLMNSKFLGRLYTSRCCLFFFNAIQLKAFFSFWETWDRVSQQKIPLRSLIHTAKLTVIWSICLWWLALYSNFLAVYPALHTSCQIMGWQTSNRCSVESKHWGNSWLPVRTYYC